MNLIITVIEPLQMEKYLSILRKLGLQLNLELRGRGTASKRLLDRLGLEDNPKCAVFSAAGEESTQKLMRAVKREMFIDAPGNGISVALPIKSIGGAKTLEFLQGNDPSYVTQRQDEYASEMILVIANEGFSEQIMDAAVGAGARGGTILHAKGTANKASERFYNLTLSDEKEMILIVAKAEEKTAIMKAVLKNCGKGTEAGAIAFSLPVSAAMGLRSAEDAEDAEKEE